MRKLKLNKKKILTSVFLVPMAVPIFTTTYIFAIGFDFSSNFLAEWLGLTLLGMIYGALVWIPAMLICLLIEYLIIQENSGVSNIYISFAIESAIGVGLALTVFGGILNIFENGLFPYFLIFSVLVTQGIRVLYLNVGNKLYLQEIVVSNDDEILDD